MGILGFRKQRKDLRCSLQSMKEAAKFCNSEFCDDVALVLVAIR